MVVPIARMSRSGSPPEKLSVEMPGLSLGPSALRIFPEVRMMPSAIPRLVNSPLKVPAPPSGQFNVTFSISTPLPTSVCASSSPEKPPSTDNWAWE